MFTTFKLHRPESKGGVRTFAVAVDSHEGVADVSRVVNG